MSDDRLSEIYEEYWIGRNPYEPIDNIEIWTLYYNKGRADAIREFADKMIVMMSGHRQDILQIAEQLKEKKE